MSSLARQRQDRAQCGQRALARERNGAVEQAAQLALRGAHHVPLRSITCDFNGGVLVLRGQVPSYYLRQLAHVAVSKVEGVAEVDNQLVIT